MFWKNILALCVGTGIGLSITIFAIKTKKETADKIVDNGFDVLKRIADLKLTRLENQVGEKNV